jgi:hypothetical protein
MARCLTDDTLKDAVLAVPAEYGTYLERLCYSCRYSSLCWAWYRNKYREKIEDTPDSPFTSLDLDMGRTWKYHHDALVAVIIAVEQLGDSPSQGARIRALDEWVIRERYNLRLESKADIEERRLSGHFSEDVIANAPEFGTWSFY